MRNTGLFASILLSGLVGGFMFGWTVSVLPGLKAASDSTSVSTMQNINREIINPGFVIPFIVTPFVLAAASFVHFRSGQARRGWLLASACAVYTVGVLGITGVGNVPLNNSLDEFVLDTATVESLAARRRNFEAPWNRWHYLRTAASILTFAAASAATLVAIEPE